MLGFPHSFFPFPFSVKKKKASSASSDAEGDSTRVLYRAGAIRYRPYTREIYIEIEESGCIGLEIYIKK
jgi:hypothetical protein